MGIKQNVPGRALRVAGKTNAHSSDRSEAKTRQVHLKRTA